MPAPSTPKVTDQPHAPASSRYILPKDLSNAIKHLIDEELDRLLTVALAEAKRRGRPLPPRDNTARRSPVEAAAVSLTRGQINTAFRAGVTPARIARQFGLSHSEVRKVLATD
jgi:DNA invertase Pin-like site-specific DNA recombinase